jgi:hypothetical protein
VSSSPDVCSTDIKSRKYAWILNTSPSLICTKRTTHICSTFLLSGVQSTTIEEYSAFFRFSRIYSCTASEIICISWFWISSPK